MVEIPEEICQFLKSHQLWLEFFRKLASRSVWFR